MLLDVSPGTTPYAPCTSPQDQPFLQGALVPLIRDWCLGTKIGGPDALIATEVSLLLGPRGDRAEFVFIFFKLKFPLLAFVGSVGSS